MHPAHIRFIAQRLCRRLNVDAGEVESALAAAMSEVEENSFPPPGHEAPTHETTQPKGYVKIPFMTKASDGAPLQRVIARAADRADASQYRTAMLMTFFLEAICREVCGGNVVRVPGFGIFGPYLWDGRGDPSKSAVYPRFIAARAFRNEVSGECPPELAKNEILSNFQRSHHPSSRPRRAEYSRTMTALESFRGHIHRQSGGFC